MVQTEKESKVLTATTTSASTGTSSSSITISPATSTWVTYHPILRKKYKISGYLPTENVYMKEVIYSNPATVVIWSDGTKTISKCTENDEYNEEVGLTLCVLKKVLGATAVKNILADWVPEQTFFNTQKITLSDVMKKHK